MRAVIENGGVSRLLVPSAVGLGFRVDPHERLDEVYDTLRTLYRVYADSPVFGIVYTVETTPQTLQNLKVERKEDEMEILDDQGMGSDAALLAYLSMDEKERETDDGSEEIIFDNNLGLAVENLPSSFSTAGLFAMF